MSRSHTVRLLVPLLVAAMSANALPLASLDEKTASIGKWGGVNFLRERRDIGLRVPFMKKARWFMGRYGGFKGLALFALALTGLPLLFGVTGSLNVTNSIYQGGNPRERCIATFKVKTVTNLRAGVFVRIDTTDSEIQAAGAEAANVIGVMTELNWDQPKADGTSAPTAGDMVTVVLIEHGARVKVRNGANIAMGAALATSATGRAAAIGTATFAGMVGRALESADGSGAEGFLLAVI